MVMNTPPNDVRYFVHKKLFGAAKGFITSGGNPLAAVGGFLASGGAVADAQKQRARQAKFQAAGLSSTGLPLSPCPLPNLRGADGVCRKRDGSNFGPPVRRVARRALTIPDLPVVGCIPPFFSDGRGGCELDIVPGPGGGGTGPMRDVGESTMGRYGAALVPGEMPISRSVCLRGMVLADDGLCYNKSQITNKERMWPRGRRPLLTGGDMRAISTAARAGKRLEGATKRLQKIGLMKKPAPRRSAAQIHHAK